jgi:ADP-ribosylation factor GTPase-activating protein 1
MTSKALTNPKFQLAEADLATQARLTAAQLAKTAQSGAKGAADGFNRFVEGSDGSGTGSRRAVPIDESKKDFWDSFGKPTEPKPSAIGTAAMRGNGTQSMAGKKDDEWESW